MGGTTGGETMGGTTGCVTAGATGGDCTTGAVCTVSSGISGSLVSTGSTLGVGRLRPLVLWLRLQLSLSCSALTSILTVFETSLISLENSFIPFSTLFSLAESFLLLLLMRDSIIGMTVGSVDDF